MSQQHWCLIKRKGTLGSHQVVWGEVTGMQLDTLAISHQAKRSGWYREGGRDTICFKAGWAAREPLLADQRRGS